MTTPSNSNSQQSPPPIRVFDAFGREILIPREQWAEQILPQNIKAVWDQPNRLFALVNDALNSGFGPVVLGAAEHLSKTDPFPVRGGCLWAVTLIQVGRTDEAESVLKGLLTRENLTQQDQAAIRVNWAKVYAKREDKPKVEELLWSSLELNPNEGLTVDWYESLLKEKGEEKRSETLLKLASLPDSWRAKMFLASDALKNKNLEQALVLYDDILCDAPQPVPADILARMSGELGERGFLAEIPRLVGPHFRAELHGLEVGNNLIVALVNLGHIEPAAAVLNQLFALKRAEWRQQLYQLDAMLHRARVDQLPPIKPEDRRLGIGVLNEPIWLRTNSTSQMLFAPKAAGSPIIAFIGSSVEAGQNMKPQIFDRLARLSRAFPLFLAEQIHFLSNGLGQTLTPSVAGGGRGFAVRPIAWEAGQLYELAQLGEVAPAFVISVHLDVRNDPPKMVVMINRLKDRTSLTSFPVPFNLNEPAPALMVAMQQIRAVLEREIGLTAVANPAYQLPNDFLSYLLLLAESLSITASMAQPNNQLVLAGERQIIQSNLMLSLANPKSISTRLLLAHTLLQLKAARPHVLPEFATEIRLLQQEHPLPEPAQAILLAIIDEALREA